jgi:predicted DNA-binding transcriptional regulator YafY
MPDSAIRQVTMLQLIPRRYPGISTEELRQKLEQRGYPISLRSIQRDLIRLSAVFPLHSEDEESPRWRWMEGADGLMAPAHDAFSALTWALMEEHLEPLLPIALRQEARPQFVSARKYLEQAPSARARRWKQRVRVIPRAFSLRPPEVPETVLEPVYQALFEGKQLDITYRSRGSGKTSTWRTHPQAMVMREGVIYLLMTIEPYSDLRHIVAHRIRSVSVIDEPVSEPEGFDLDDYIQSGAFSYVETGPVELVIRLQAYAAEHILESPISADQSHRTLSDGRIEIAASTIDTLQLRWWLTGFGDALEVVEPADLRQAMAEQAKAVAAMYKE